MNFLKFITFVDFERKNKFRGNHANYSLQQQYFKLSYWLCLWAHGFILVVVGLDGIIFIQKNCFYYKNIENITIRQHETKTL